MRGCQAEKSGIKARLVHHEADSSRRVKELESIVKTSKQDILALETQLNAANSEKERHLHELQSQKLSEAGKTVNIEHPTNKVKILRGKIMKITKENADSRIVNDKQRNNFFCKMMAVQAAVHMPATAFANLQAAPSFSNDDTISAKNTHRSKRIQRTTSGISNPSLLQSISDLFDITIEV